MSRLENLSTLNLAANDKEQKEKLFDLVFKALQDLKFGSLEIIIHNSRVVQIEKKEKIRLQ